jgi:hypothetical protein
MLSFRKLALLVVAAGSVLSAQAQTDQSDADRRMRNREEVMARRQQMDREGGTSVPAVVPARAHYHHGAWVRHHRMHLHRHRHHPR